MLSHLYHNIIGRNFILLAFTMLLSSLVFAQENNTGKEDIKIEKFDEQQWNDLKDETNYWRNKKKKKKKEDQNDETVHEERPVRSKGMGEINFGPLMYVFIGVFICLLVYVLLRVFASELFGSSKKISNEASFSLEDIEDNLEEAPLQRFLREALESGSYKLAIRVYYLSILQELNNKKQIIWKKEKTNSHYVNEMRVHSKSKEFRLITRIFEKVWYGELDDISIKEFEFIQPAFENFIQEIK